MSDNTHRCSICDRTNNHDLCLTADQYTPGPFRVDPHNPMFEICAECDSEVYETLQLWEDEEEDD